MRVVEDYKKGIYKGFLQDEYYNARSYRPLR
jgi:hypothetical protein